MDVMTKRASANAIKNAMADRTEKAASKNPKLKAINAFRIHEKKGETI